MTPVRSRVCTKCGLDKSLDEYHDTPLGRYGKYAHCKLCHNAMVARGAKQPDALAARAKRLASQREHINARQRRYYAEHRDALAAYYSVYHKERPEGTAVRNHRRRMRLAAAEGGFTAEEWIALCERCEFKCLACGKHEVTVDHVIPVSEGGSNTIDNIQPLCGPCNSSKGTKTIDYRLVLR